MSTCPFKNRCGTAVAYFSCDLKKNTFEQGCTKLIREQNHLKGELPLHQRIFVSDFYTKI